MNQVSIFTGGDGGGGVGEGMNGIRGESDEARVYIECLFRADLCGSLLVFLVIFISGSIVFSKKYGFNCLCKGFPFAFAFLF